jgi:hypothetical protein
MISASQAEADRLNSVSPGARAEITKAQEDAEQAMARADQALAERRSTISDLEAQILALGKYRVKIEQVRGTFATDPDTAANAALDALCAHLESPCPATQGTYNLLVERFVVCQGMLPHVSRRLSAMEARGAAMLSDLKATAKRSKVDLGNLLALLRDESAEVKRGHMRNVEVHQLFAAGFLSIEDAK